MSFLRMTGDMPGVFCCRAGLLPFGKPFEEGEKESARAETYESGIVEEKETTTTTTLSFFWAALSTPFVALYLLSVADYVINSHSNIQRKQFLRVRRRRRTAHRSRRRAPLKITPRRHQKLISVSPSPVFFRVDPRQLPQRPALALAFHRLRRIRLCVVDCPPSRSKRRSLVFVQLPWLWCFSRKSHARPRVRVPRNVSCHECRPRIGRVVRRHDQCARGTVCGWQGSFALASRVRRAVSLPFDPSSLVTLYTSSDALPTVLWSLENKAL